MRVPDGLMQRFVTKELSSVTARLARYQTEISSGVRIQRPSDDPGGALRAANLRSGLTQLAQYQRGARFASSWLKSEEVALGNMHGLMRQVRDVGLRAASPTDASAREALAKQVETMSQAFIQEANATDGARFLFAGHQTMSAPITGSLGAVAYNGDTGDRWVQIGDGVKVDLNHNGGEVFNVGGAADPTQPDIFTTMNELAQAIRTDDQATIQTKLGEVDSHMQRLVNMRAETGTRLQQVNLATDRLDQSKMVLNDLLGETEATDIAEALIKLKSEENLYQAATYIAGTLAKPGLLNWLN